MRHMNPGYRTFNVSLIDAGVLLSQLASLNKLIRAGNVATCRYGRKYQIFPSSCIWSIEVVAVLTKCPLPSQASERHQALTVLFKQTPFKSMPKHITASIHICRTDSAQHSITNSDSERWTTQNRPLYLALLRTCSTAIPS
jgi:hypothetical protein